MIQVAIEFLGRPYVWGGDDPVEGFDCSGLVVECLNSVGRLPREGDWTAEELWRKFLGSDHPDPKRGDLVFWKSQETDWMIHVEICSNDEISIGASGGGSGTLSLADAIK
jgi:cell wall-associated NlpC family hydrolase